MALTTLKKASEFQKVRHQGKRFVSSDFIIQAYFYPSPVPLFRLGLIASKKVGNAVARNRAKRRIRALVGLLVTPPLAQGVDYVVVARATLVHAPFDSLKDQFAKALAYLHG